MIDMRSIIYESIPDKIDDNAQWNLFLKRILEVKRNPGSFEFLNKYLINSLKVGSDSKVLEVGAGVGLHAIQLAFHEVVVTDLDIVKANVELINHLCQHYCLSNFNIVLGDSCNIPFKDSFFDGIFSMSCFEHIRDQDKALDEQIRVLKKGGRLLIIDGNILCPNTILDMLISRPINSRGRQGGLKWLLNKNRVYSDYGLGWPGKDEDVKSIFYWKKKIHNKEKLKLIEINTEYSLKADNVIAKFLWPFLGRVFVLAEKII